MHSDLSQIIIKQNLGNSIVSQIQTETISLFLSDITSDKMISREDLYYHQLHTKEVSLYNLKCLCILNKQTLDLTFSYVLYF